MRELFHNADRVELTGAGARPLRFSPAQLAHYAELSEAAGTRSLCTAGVTLEFVTDAPEIAFSYRADHFSRAHVGFDVVENGRLCAHIAEPDHSPGGRVAYRRRERGPSAIRIHLSNLNCVTVTDVDFGDWRPLPPKVRVILYLGDSITQGMTARCPSLTYPALLSRHFAAESLNMGVGGMRFDPAHLDGMPALRPWRVVVAYGINDIYREDDIAPPLRNAAAFLEKLRTLYPAAPVDVVTPLWNAKLEEDPDFPPRFAAYAGGLAELAVRNGCHPVDGLALVPHDGRHFADGTHPNELGFSQYALGLLERLQKV